MTETRGLCGATAASCTCAEPAGHDGPHICENTTVCGGQWAGTHGEDDFRPVVLPLDDGSPLMRIYNLLAGIE